MSKVSYALFLFRVLIAGEMQKARIYSKYYGVKMGRNVRITGSIHFPTEAFLIEIGNDVTLTNNITFHTHDGGVGILRKELNGINVFGRIIVGNNVFIGSDTIILPSVMIGSNVVIGAGSVVTKNIPDNTVAAGNPARILCTTDEYRQNALAKATFLTTSDLNVRRQEIINSFFEKEKNTSM